MLEQEEHNVDAVSNFLLTYPDKLVNYLSWSGEIRSLSSFLCPDYWRHKINNTWIFPAMLAAKNPNPYHETLTLHSNNQGGESSNTSDKAEVGTNLPFAAAIEA